MSDDMRATGVGPNWMSYVTVADAHAAAARAHEFGGAVIDDAFDVLDVGRMAVLKDPQGAVLALWQPGTRIGAERVNDVGCLCMNELATTDLEAAGSFYGRVFDWTTELGGRQLSEPLDIGHGTIAMVRDPQGAVFTMFAGEVDP